MSFHNPVSLSWPVWNSTAIALTKGCSLSDCIAMQTMRREGIADVLTNGHHFKQEVYRVLFQANP